MCGRPHLTDVLTPASTQTRAAKMFKKMQMGRSREPKISNPVLLDTTLDLSHLRSSSGSPVLPLKDDSKDLPALPR